MLSGFLMGCAVSRPIERAPDLVNGEVRLDGARSGLSIFNPHGQQTCSATVLQTSKRTAFVTAAHCLHVFKDVREISLGRTMLTPDGGAKLITIGRIKEWRAPKDYVFKSMADVNPKDIAVGISDRAFPADMRGAELPDSDWIPGRPGHKVLLIGAGALDAILGADHNPIQVRTGDYTNAVEIERASSLSSLRDFVSSSPLKPGDMLKLAAPGDRDAYMCAGDSGGSVLEDNVLVGVLVVFGLRTLNGIQQCWWQPFGAVPVSIYSDWIKKTLRDLQAD